MSFSWSIKTESQTHKYGNQHQRTRKTKKSNDTEIDQRSYQCDLSTERQQQDHALLTQPNDTTLQQRANNTTQQQQFQADERLTNTTTNQQSSLRDNTRQQLETLSTTRQSLRTKHNVISQPSLVNQSHQTTTPTNHKMTYPTLSDDHSYQTPR